MIKEFKINIPQPKIDDLKERIKKTRWLDETENSDWKLGTEINYLKELSDYWESEFNWRKIEDKINSFPNYITEIDNLKVHFLYIKSDRENSIPLLITHGWPGSFLEMLKIIPLLKDEFDLVIPSIIGFGFSENKLKNDADYGFVADIWHKLMVKLGYQNYGLQGGDLGAGISIRLAQKHPENIIGMHLNYISDSYKPYSAEENNNEVKEYQEYLKNWNEKEGAYAIIQSTKPLSLAYGLNNSPIGLCAWILEKFNAWSDNNGNIENCFSKDELLANISLYWFTKTIYSSIKFYHGISLSPLVFKETDFINVPVGYAKFPKEIPIPPRKYIEKGLNIVHWTEMPKGGHFAALEQPELLVSDLKAFFRKIEKSTMPNNV
ncbi:epoxide hydrolase family protein [Flagellimonas eckloniae]|uniref:Multidrug MFS transporter n=1 Tax=Flagellimonas eckloniae TaxID=346185 RepID=A0A0Q0XNT8_9FLAO|nr:epoxide hydrolase family protein [Allomuricauda eckloniae]KQC30711.1 multidrug MFS transporter [Allomuricauda eckloniae]